VFRPSERLVVVSIEDPLEQDESFKAGDADKKAQAMPRQYAADLAVAASLRMSGDVSQINRLGPGIG